MHEHAPGHSDHDHQLGEPPGTHSHPVGHQHGHSHAVPDTLGPKLLLGVVVNLVIVVVQVIAGLLTNSLALLSDAAHNLSDVVSLVLSYVANRLGKRPPTPRRTFAFRRAEVLAAFINAAGLIAVSVFLAYEGIGRLLEPVAVDGLPVMLVAGMGLVANAGTAMLLKGHDDLNARSAFVHLMADALTSLGVVVAGLLIWAFNLYAADSVITIVVALWMVREAWKILRESTNILLEGMPSELDFWTVSEAMSAIEGVRDVHALHVWAISSKEFALSAHVEVEDGRLSELAEIVRQEKVMLLDRFGITHPTIEIECAVGGCAGGVCAVAIGAHTG